MSQDKGNADDFHLCHVCYRWWHASDFAELRAEHKVCHYCTHVGGGDALVLKAS